MSGSVDDGDVVLGSLELPQGNIDGDTTFALGLQLVQNPGILEGALAHLQGKRDKRYEFVFNKWASCLVSFLTSWASFSNFSMVRLSIPPHW